MNPIYSDSDDSSEEYSVEEQQFGYEEISSNNYDRSRSGSPSEYNDSLEGSIREGKGYGLVKNYPFPFITINPNIQNNQQKTTQNKTMSYEDTMKLIDYIFISNYYDKKKGTAILVDSKQISTWLDHFKNINFEMPVTKSMNKLNNHFVANLHDVPMIINESYNIIYEILLLGKGQISLCGGSLVELINRRENYGDWDLFFHCETIKEADELLKDCLELIENNRLNGLADYVRHSRNQRVHTVEYGQIQIQFIKRIYKSKDQILLGFDLAPSRIGFNPFDGLYATICGGSSIAMRNFPLDTTQRSMSFGYRLNKYLNKGFNILYPGIPRNFNGVIETPDGQLGCYNDVTFRCKSTFESDYDGNDGSYLNWFYISSEKYHLITFQGDLEEVTELSEDFVEKSIQSNYLFGMNKDRIKHMNIKTNKFFLTDKYKEFINAMLIDEDEQKACQIWQEKCEWYVEKGIELAQLLKENHWKTENPGSQSFGKFNPILEHPKLWYGDHYQSVEVGIKTPQYVALVSCLINIIPKEVIREICVFWLQAETNIARDYLFGLNNPGSNQSSVVHKPVVCKPIVHRQKIPTVHTIYNLG